MKNFCILIVSIINCCLLFSCNSNHSAKSETSTADMQNLNFENPSNQEQSGNSNNLSFTHIIDVTNQDNPSIWVNKGEASYSLALHFRYKDTLLIGYSTECLFLFPYEVKKDSIIVKWDNNIDTKYDFELVKAINNVEKKYVGKPFMILTLLNDSTLTSSYPLKSLVGKLNASSSTREFFPKTYRIVRDGEWQE